MSDFLDDLRLAVRLRIPFGCEVSVCGHEYGCEVVISNGRGRTFRQVVPTTDAPDRAADLIARRWLGPTTIRRAG